MILVDSNITVHRARRAVRVAMERHGVERIMSFDTGFDGYPGVIRIAS